MPPPSPFPSKQKQNSPSQSTAMQIYGSWFTSMKRNAVWSRGRARREGLEQKVAFNAAWRQTDTRISFWKAGIFPPGRASSQQIPTTQSPTGEGQHFPQARKPSPLRPAQAHLQNKDTRPPTNTLPQQHWFPPGGDLRIPPFPGEPPCLSVHPWI